MSVYEGYFNVFRNQFTFQKRGEGGRDRPQVRVEVVNARDTGTTRFMQTCGFFSCIVVRFSTLNAEAYFLCIGWHKNLFPKAIATLNLLITKINCLHIAGRIRV